MSKVFLLNGPPRSGKDTATDFLWTRRQEVERIKFAEPLHSTALSCLSELDKEYYGVTNKTEVIPHIGVSYRQLCIDISEKFFKPNYGDDVFGRIAADRMVDLNSRSNKELNFVFSDSGFEYEVKPVIDLIGKENVHLFHIIRDGCSYSGDSRNYIDLLDYGIYPIVIRNDDLLNYRLEVLDWYDKLTAKS